MRALGKLVTRRRWWVIGFALIFLPVAGLLGGGVEKRLSSGGFTDPASESARAADILEERFRAGTPNLVLLVTARSGTVDDPGVGAAGLALTKRLTGEKGITNVVSYWALGRFGTPLRSKDGRQALVLGRVPGDEDEVRDATEGLSARYAGKSGPIDVGMGGAGEVFNQIEAQAEKDLKKAELLTFPITVILLVLVFGSVVAAGLPLAVGALAVVGTFLVLRVVTSLTDVSIFALNLTTAMGLGLAIDYSLFVVSRYREELRHGYEPDQAVTRSLYTAGRTVAFSALTVAISLAALVVFPLPFLRSFAYAGAGVVLMAAVGAVVVLPAVLSALGRRVDSLALFHRQPKAVEDGFWYGRARAVMRRPIPVVIVVTGLLLVLGAPFVHLDLGLSDDRVLGEQAPARVVGDDIRHNFDSKEAGALAVVAPAADPAADRAAIDGYAKTLSDIDGVFRVDAATGFYRGGMQVAPPNQLSARFSGTGTPGTPLTPATPGTPRTLGGTWLSVVPTVEPLSPAGEQLVHAVRSAAAPVDVLVTGDSARLVDGKASLGSRLPLAIGIIGLATFLLLFLMTGSLLVPAKALILNVLSLSATFGALVWVFQEGHLAGPLDFTPTGTISIFTPVLLFCIAFGLSMDYEVFLLSRIKEEYDLGAGNEDAVAIGLERTGRIVTAAALLLALVFVAFATAEVTVVKVFGVGLALAVLVDAFLIRATLVPAFMRLAGRANWWAPRALRRFHLRWGIFEDEPPEILDRIEAAGRAQV
jgi:RND superfamily putative drug exporter